ncbi:MAG: hypothetical protein K8R87_04425 [Verrucomicrobia bacterium]|nr:hypothetical protein [Verrucomicrobiota bacterium]
MNLELNSTHLWALALGFALGALLLFFSLRGHWRTSREFKRYKNMLSDKLELEQKQLTELSKERERLLKDNENLRVKVVQLNERADNKLARDLEVYARAEKQMKINAPGFAGAWELAKESAQNQITEEERGNSLPQRIFRKLIGGAAPVSQNLPVESNAKNGTAAESSVS